MSKAEGYVKKTEEFLAGLKLPFEFEVVDVEYVKEAGNWYLRAYCDTKSGIGVDECADISRALSDWLDKEDFIDDSYILEVSSPGLGRALKKDKDFERELGKRVELKLYKAVDGLKENDGILKSYDKDTVTIVSDNGDITYDRSNIAIIRLAIDF